MSLYCYASLLLLIAAASVSRAQVVDFNATCPPIKVVSNFDKNKFAGKWYEMQKYILYPEMLGKCVTETYDTEFVILYKSDRQRTDMISQQTTTDTSRLLFVDNDQTKGDFTAIRLVTVGQQPFPIPLRYQILDTDYTSYYVGYSCTELFGTRLTLLFVFTRSKTPDSATLEKAISAIKAQNLNTSNLVNTDRTMCPSTY